MYSPYLRQLNIRETPWHQAMFRLTLGFALGTLTLPGGFYLEIDSGVRIGTLPLPRRIYHIDLALALIGIMFSIVGWNSLRQEHEEYKLGAALYPIHAVFMILNISLNVLLPQRPFFLNFVIYTLCLADFGLLTYLAYLYKKGLEYFQEKEGIDFESLTSTLLVVLYPSICISLYTRLSLAVFLYVAFFVVIRQLLRNIYIMDAKGCVMESDKAQPRKLLLFFYCILVVAIVFLLNYIR